jgi:hypothetical protein
MKTKNTSIPRIKPKMEMRELNETEKLMAVLLSANVHGLIRDIDELKKTNLYRHKLKLYAKQFLEELEKHAQQQVWAVEVEGVSLDAAADQLNHIAMMHRNLLFTVMMAGDMHEAQLQLFWQDMQMTFKRHNIPLQLTPTGELIPLSNDHKPVIIDTKK